MSARAAGAASLSYAFGEPAVFYEYMADLAAGAKAAGRGNLIHTSGYIRPRPLGELSKNLAGANVDLKGFEPDFYREFCGGELRPVLDSLVLLREAGVHLEITNLLIPPLNDNPDQLQEMCLWIRKELGPDVPLHFIRFYPLYRLVNLPPPGPASSRIISGTPSYDLIRLFPSLVPPPARSSRGGAMTDNQSNTLPLTGYFKYNSPQTKSQTRPR